MLTTLPAVLYARVSPRPKRSAARTDETSCTAQLEFCRRYCQLYGYQIIGEFTDELLSGKDVKGRPGFKRALKLAVHNRAILVAYSQSRFARNTEQACRLIRYLLKRGCNLASCKEHIDTSSAFGRLTYRFKAVLDEFEREQTAERTSDAMKSHQSHGRRMSAQPPYGQMPDPNDSARWIPNPAELAAIERIRELAQLPKYRRADGSPQLSRIARQLDKEHRPSRNGKWHHTTVRRILER